MKAASADLREAAASMKAAQADAMQGMGGGKGFLGKLGKGLKGGAAGILGGLALDAASQYAMESGNEKLGAGLDVGSSALSGAGTGALIGSVIPGVGTVVGGAVGGVLGGLYGLFQNKDTLFGSGTSPANQLEMANDAELQKQLDIISSITTPGNGQDMLETMSPEQLSALGISTSNQYTVKQGDTLENIAKANGITTDELLAANSVVKQKDWKEGYKLNIPGMASDLSNQPQLAFAKQDTQEIIEDAENARDRENKEKLGMLEDQQASVNDLIMTNSRYVNSTESAAKALRTLRDLMNELNKILGGTDENGNAVGPGGANLAGPMQFGGDTDRILATIRQMESGNNYTAQNPTSSASGAYQFIDSTWQSLTKKYGIGAEYKSAKDAPPGIQDQVAQRYLSEILEKANGDVSKVPVAWFTGNVSGKSNAVSQNEVSGYQSKWLGIYNKQPAGSPMMAVSGVPGGTSGVNANLQNFAAMLQYSTMMGNPYGGMPGMYGMPSPDIVSLGKMLEAQGLRISENPAFGGIKGQHRGRGHAEGRAIDINVGTGNKEADHPVMGARFDMLAEQLRRSGYTVLWRTAGHYDHMHVETPGLNKLPYAEKGGVFKGPDSGYLAMLHGKEAVVPLDNNFTRSQSSAEYTVNGKKVGKKEYDSFMKSHPELQNIQDKVKSMLSAVQGGKADPARLMQAASSLMDTNLTGIKDEIIDKNKKIQDSITQMVATETNKAVKAVNEANLPMQTMANQMSTQMRKVMEAHTQSMNELAYKLTEMIDAMNTSNDTTKKILKKASA